MDVALSQPQLRNGVVHSGNFRRPDGLFDGRDGQAHNSQTFSLSAGVGAFALTIQLHTVWTPFFLMYFQASGVVG